MLPAVKTIGLLGGMSWESTALYYEIINEEMRNRLGGLNSAECILRSVNFATIEEMQRDGLWDDAAALLAGLAKDLEEAGADIVLLCTNTMHICAPAIEASLTVPFLHLADATAAAVKRKGIEKVALLGTAFTMEKDFYKSRIASHGIEVIVPNEPERKDIHRVIYDELCMGVVRDESRTRYEEIIDRLIGDGAEGVIAGCTEIELLVTDENCPVALFPTSRIHAEAAVDFALA